jgi:tripartite-type tricarboxylate transporter receptor subunit TctC
MEMKRFSGRTLTARCVLTACLGMLMCAGVHAQSYPTKPLRFIVPFAPGGGIDVLSRALAPVLQASMGQAVVVDNRPASAGIVGADTVAKSAPDGYTFMAGGSWMVVGSLLYKTLPYHVERDFTPVALIADASVQIIIHASIPASNFTEFIAYAKAIPANSILVQRAWATRFISSWRCSSSAPAPT